MEPQPSLHTYAAVPGFSLLRASTRQRLALVAAMLVVLWLAVLWALQ
jgi:hypothetical protein